MKPNPEICSCNAESELKFSFFCVIYCRLTIGLVFCFFSVNSVFKGVLQSLSFVSVYQNIHELRFPTLQFQDAKYRVPEPSP